MHKQFVVHRTPTDKTAMQRQIDATDGRFAQLGYGVCGLAGDEIRIVAEATT